MKWITEVNCVEVSEMLQKLLFKHCKGDIGVLRERYCIDDSVACLGVREEDLSWARRKGGGINNNCFDDFEKISLTEAIKRLTPQIPKDFTVEVNPETSALLQKLAFKKNIQWASKDSRPDYLNCQTLSFIFSDYPHLYGQSYYFGTYPSVKTVSEAIQILTNMESV